MTRLDSDAIFDLLDGARLVRYDRARALLLVWSGGHGVRAFDPWWREVAFWNTGDFRGRRRVRRGRRRVDGAADLRRRRVRRMSRSVATVATLRVRTRSLGFGRLSWIPLNGAIERTGANPS
jgi:hypothetical protein